MTKSGIAASVNALFRSIRYAFVEFDFDNAFLAVQVHDSADEAVLYILQNHFSPN